RAVHLAHRASAERAEDRVMRERMAGSEGHVLWASPRGANGIPAWPRAPAHAARPILSRREAGITARESKVRRGPRAGERHHHASRKTDALCRWTTLVSMACEIPV